MLRWLLIPITAAWVIHGIHGDEELDETKARLLATYRLPTTRPTLAAARLGLDDDHSCGTDALPTRVRLQVYVSRFHQLDQDAQTFGFDGYFRVWWTDPRLRFNSTQCVGSRFPPELSFSRQETAQIWKPDLYWEDALQVTLPDAVAGIKDGAGEMLIVSTGGDVFWSRQARFTLACPMRLSQLPFDTQRCAYTVVLYSDKAEEVTVSWREDADAIESWSTKCLSEWVATSLKQKDIMQTYTSGNHSYVLAHLSFTRIPDRYIYDYMLQSMVMVIISWLGFLIDPTATPARVALGIITVMVVLQNYIALSSTLPSGVKNAWLGQFTLISFAFNVAAFIEQVLVSFGIQAFKWLEQQRAFIDSVHNWQSALLQNRHALLDLLTEWDTNDDGQISKKEFRKGVQALYPTAPPSEVHALFDSYSANSSGTMELVELIKKMQQHEHLLRMPPMGKDTSPKRPAASFCLTVPQRMLAPIGAAAGAVLVGPTPHEDEEENSAIQAEAISQSMASRRHVAKSGVTATRLPPKPPAAAPTTAPSMGSKRSRRMAVFAVEPPNVREETRKARKNVMRHSREELGKSKTWAFKTFYLFPCLVQLRHLDHLSRFMFPCAYLIYILIHLSSINFGKDQHGLLKDHLCYQNSN